METFEADFESKIAAVEMVEQNSTALLERLHRTEHALSEAEAAHTSHAAEKLELTQQIRAQQWMLQEQAEQQQQQADETVDVVLFVDTRRVPPRTRPTCHDGCSHAPPRDAGRIELRVEPRPAVAGNDCKTGWLSSRWHWVPATPS